MLDQVPNPFWRALMESEGDFIDPAEVLARYIRRPAWMTRAACRGDHETPFFPAIGQTAGAARAICDDCPVRSECLAYALADPDLDGIWAGTTAQQRRTIRRGAPAA